MQVATVKTADNKERYMLFDSNGESVDVVNRYLKYKDSYGSARNTLKTYCYHLKLYFEYLEQSKLDFLGVFHHRFHLKRKILNLLLLL